MFTVLSIPHARPTPQAVGRLGLAGQHREGNWARYAHAFAHFPRPGWRGSPGGGSPPTPAAGGCRHDRDVHRQVRKVLPRGRGLDVDKSDLKRYSDFVDAKLYDLLTVAQATAKANGRDVIRTCDLPITKGLQESIHHFRKIDQEVDLKPILEQLATHPALDRTPDEETEAAYPDIIGGLSLALAQSFKILHPDVKNPQTQHWDEARAVFDLLL
ncbi:DUF1931 family protein [Streptomyces mexicanus]